MFKAISETVTAKLEAHSTRTRAILIKVQRGPVKQDLHKHRPGTSVWDHVTRAVKGCVSGNRDTWAHFNDLSRSRSRSSSRSMVSLLVTSAPYSSLKILF